MLLQIRVKAAERRDHGGDNAPLAGALCVLIDLLPRFQSVSVQATTRRTIRLLARELGLL